MTPTHQHHLSGSSLGLEAALGGLTAATTPTGDGGGLAGFDMDLPEDFYDNEMQTTPTTSGDNFKVCTPRLGGRGGAPLLRPRYRCPAVLSRLAGSPWPCQGEVGLCEWTWGT